MDLTVSIVLYRSSRDDVGRAIASVLCSTLDVRVLLVDNSPDDRLGDLAADERVSYRHLGRNVGFGAGHNQALADSRGLAAPYHLILNPDAAAEPGTLEALHGYMQAHADIGLIMPRIVSDAGETQNLCRIHPRPLDLIGRRFLPRAWLGGRLDRFERRELDHRVPADVDILSGCFMFARRAALEEAGGFDERYFLYLEDYDLCRRIGRRHRLVYYPLVAARHGYGGHSYRSARALRLHIRSAIAYFNKWGWWPAW